MLGEIQEQELDYDPFVNAQDYNSQWLKTMKIVNDPKKTNGFIVSFTNTYNRKVIHVKLLVVNTKGIFRVSKIY